MISGLKCECCGGPMEADLSNNVWCINKECLVFDKCYDHEWIASRKKNKVASCVNIPLECVFHLITENVHRELSGGALDIVKETLKYVSLNDIKVSILKHYGSKSVEDFKEDHNFAYVRFEKYFGEILWR